MACTGEPKNTPISRLDWSDSPDPAQPGGEIGIEQESPANLEDPMLLVYGGPQDGAAIPILKRKATFGSLPDNDFVIDGIGVHRRHAEIFGSSTGYYLKDLAMVNCTFVNRRDIGDTDYLLRHGDRIHLGDSTIFHVFMVGNQPVTKSRFNQPLETSTSIPADQADLQERAGGLDTRQPAWPTDGDNGAKSDFLRPKAEIYEGIVHINVQIGGQVRSIIDFVASLRHNPSMRLLRMVGNPPNNVVIWLSLREPMPLEQILDHMEAVTEVDSGECQPDGVTEPGCVMTIRLKKTHG